MKAMIKYSMAKQLGLNIDDTVYPHVAYLGPRFAPTLLYRCMTDLEEKAIDTYMRVSDMVASEAVASKALSLEVLQEIYLGAVFLSASVELIPSERLKAEVKLAKAKVAKGGAT